MGMNCDCPVAGSSEVRYLGSTNAPIVFIGESPSYEEVRSNKPFSGRGGRILKQACLLKGINIADCFLMYASRCLINKDDLSTKEVNKVIHTCRDNVKTMIRHIKPKIVVTFGALALQQILKMKGVKKARGNFYWSEEFNCWVLPNWSPNYILRNAAEEDNFIRVFGVLADFIENDYEIKKVDEFEWEEVDSIQYLLDGGLQKAEDDSCFITAVDTESQGVEWYSEDSITISYSVAESENKGVNVILCEECELGEGDFDIMVRRGGTKKDPDLAMIGIKRTDDYDRKIEELKELFRRQDIQKYFMNQKFDMHYLEKLGVTEMNRCPLDISLAAHTLDAPRYMNANLGYLLESFCNMSGAYKDDFSPAEKADMLMQLSVQRDKFNRYACFDAVSTLKVAIQIIKEFNIDRTSLNYYINFAHPIETSFLYELERNGILIDEEALPVVAEQIDQVIKQKTEEFKNLCPKKIQEVHADKFRLTRRAILTDALFNYVDQDGVLHDIGYGVEPFEFSPKTKLPRCDKAVMKILLDAEDVPAEAKDLIQVYQEWSSYHTLKSRYINQLIDCIAGDGRIYPTYSLTYTSSGRTGARRPSVQNFPKRFVAAKLIRRLMIASKGKVLMENDHSMSELRWVAEIANEKKMAEIFRKNGDIHIFTGAGLAQFPIDIGSKTEMIQQLEEQYGLDEAEVKNTRQNAKAVNFGLIYLMSAMGLRQYAYQGFGVKLTERQAADWRNHFFDIYPDIAPWHQDTIREAEEHGQIITIFGRKIPVPNIYSSDRRVQKEAERFSVNVKIQGPSSDYTLLGGKKTIDSEEYKSGEIKGVLFIHDALVWELDEDKVDKYAKCVSNNMVTVDTTPFNFQLSTPFVAGSEVGKNLAEMEEYTT